MVISDFLAPAGWDDTLRTVAQRHEVLAVEVLDPQELELPAVGVVHPVDPESGAMVEVPTGDDAFRRRYRAAAAAQRASVRAALRTARADHLQLRTDQDWVIEVARFVNDAPRRRSGRP